MRKLGVLLLISLMSSLAFSSKKVGIVNARQALETVREGKRVLDKLKKELSVREKSIVSDQNKIQKAEAELRKKAAVLSQSGLAKKQRELQQMVRGYQEKSMKLQKELQSLEEKMKKPLIEKMGKVIEEVSRKEGIDMTYESLQAPLYLRYKVDITQKVINAYNRKHR